MSVSDRHDLDPLYNFLRPNYAGVYTCVASDVDANMGSASTDVNVVGKLITVWRENVAGIKFGDFSQNAFFEVWQILNLAIQCMCIYLWMAGFNIGSL